MLPDWWVKIPVPKVCYLTCMIIYFMQVFDAPVSADPAGIVICSLEWTIALQFHRPTRSMSFFSHVSQQPRTMERGRSWRGVRGWDCYIRDEFPCEI